MCIILYVLGAYYEYTESTKMQLQDIHIYEDNNKKSENKEWVQSE